MSDAAKQGKGNELFNSMMQQNPDFARFMQNEVGGMSPEQFMKQKMGMPIQMLNNFIGR